MIGLDTNVLVRYIAGDDPVQSPKAQAVIKTLTEEDPGWISLGCLLETVWLLDSKMKVGREAIATVIRTLSEKKELALASRQHVMEAVELYQHGRADFADCLLLASGRAAGCRKIVTFDRIAARDLGMELPG